MSIFTPKLGLNLPTQVTAENCIIENMSYTLNDYIKMSSDTLIYLSIDEDLENPFEIFHGLFIINWAEFKDNNTTLQFLSPHTMDITLKYETVSDGLNFRKYKLKIYKFIRKNYPNGNTYEIILGNYFQSLGHSSFEFFAVPDYQYNLNNITQKQISYSGKTTYEILEDLQKNHINVDFKCCQESTSNSDSYRVYTTKNLNKVQENHPFIIPSTIPILQSIQDLIMNTWYKEDIQQHSIPLFYINNNILYYKNQFSEEHPELKSVKLGDIHTNMNMQFDTDSTKLLNKISESQKSNNFIFDQFIFVDTMVNNYFGSWTKRNVQQIHEQKSEEKSSCCVNSPLVHKPTFWLNNQPLDIIMNDIYKLHKDKPYWEFDQLYLNEEYSLENRIGKTYNLQLINYFMDMTYFKVECFSQIVTNLFDKLLIGDLVNLEIQDTQFIYYDKNAKYNVHSIVKSRTLLYVPGVNTILTTIMFGTFGKFNLYQEDENKMDEMNSFWKYKTPKHIVDGVTGKKYISGKSNTDKYIFTSD